MKIDQPPQPCRYLSEDGRCGYWDMQLQDSETIRCYPGGWECYEEPGGIAYIGRWVGLGELLVMCAEAPVSEYAWEECRVFMENPAWINHLPESQIVEAEDEVRH